VKIIFFTIIDILQQKLAAELHLADGEFTVYNSRQGGVSEIAKNSNTSSMKS